MSGEIILYGLDLNWFFAWPGYFWPIVAWFLCAAIVFHYIGYRRTTNELISVLNRNTIRLIEELEENKAETAELRGDLKMLNDTVRKIWGWWVR